jgi:hypothetical protein
MEYLWRQCHPIEMNMFLFLIKRISLTARYANNKMNRVSPVSMLVGRNLPQRCKLTVPLRRPLKRFKKSQFMNVLGAREYTDPASSTAPSVLAVLHSFKWLKDR